jgi:hypothetical protein
MNLRTKRVMRYDPIQKKLRLLRVMWERGTVGSCRGFSAKLSLSLVPRLLGRLKADNGWRFTLLGVSVSYRRSYGGTFV